MTSRAKNFQGSSINGPIQTFKTQPNVSSLHKRSPSFNPKHSNASGSVMENPVAYRDPPALLSEGLYKKLYEQRSYVNRQTDSKTINFEQQIDNQKYANRKNIIQNNSIPQNQQKGSTNGYSSFKFNDYQQESLFPNTPFKQGLEDRIGFAQSKSERSSPQNFGKNLANIQHTGMNYSYLPNFRQNSPVAQTQHPQKLTNSQEIDDFHGSFEINQHSRNPYSKVVSPNYKSSLGKPRFPNLVRLEDTVKMRNPMFSSYDFSKYQDNNLIKKHFQPESYHYASTEPLAPKEFLKTHVSAIAHAQKFDMQQKTYIHPELGVIGYSEGGRKPNVFEPDFVGAQNNQPKATFARDLVSPNSEIYLKSQPNEEGRNHKTGYVSSKNIPEGSKRLPESNVHFSASKLNILQDEQLKMYGQYATTFRGNVNYPW